VNKTELSIKKKIEIILNHYNSFILIRLIELKMTDDINTLISQYLKFVWKHNNNTNETTSFEEYVLEDFRFSAGNNWDGGFDFVDWFLGQGDMAEYYRATPKSNTLERIMNFGETCRAINRIKEFYENEYGNVECFLEDMSSAENVLRHLVYVTLYEDMTFEDLCELLEIDELTDEEKQAVLERF
jgi:hypothetical protein